MCQKGSEKKRIGRVVFNEEEEKKFKEKSRKTSFSSLSNAMPSLWIFLGVIY